MVFKLLKENANEATLYLLSFKWARNIYVSGMRILSARSNCIILMPDSCEETLGKGN